MQAPALVTVGETRQPMRCLDAELLEYFHALLHKMTGIKRPDKSINAPHYPQIPASRYIIRSCRHLSEKDTVIMPASAPPLILPPVLLEKSLGNAQWLIVDLCKPDVHNQAHVPGAVHLDYAQLVTARPPAV